LLNEKKDCNDCNDVQQQQVEASRSRLCLMRERWAIEFGIEPQATLQCFLSTVVFLLLLTVQYGLVRYSYCDHTEKCRQVSPRGTTTLARSNPQFMCPRLLTDVHIWYFLSGTESFPCTKLDGGDIVPAGESLWRYVVRTFSVSVRRRWSSPKQARRRGDEGWTRWRLQHTKYTCLAFLLRTGTY
jgi:hypothetical protein